MLRSRSHPQTFGERLAEQKARFERQASKLEPGPERDELLRKARQIDSATPINEWLNSAGLQSPRSELRCGPLSSLHHWPGRPIPKRY